jgi:CheY-like chemotaxis protein
VSLRNLSVVPSVFYLENDENDFFFLHRAFKKLGCENLLRGFTHSDELKQCLNELSTEELPRIILLDLRLDGETGLDVLKWIKQNPRFKEITTFLFSSGQITEEINAAIEGNACAYIFKPCDTNSYLQLSKDLLEQFVLFPADHVTAHN